MSEESAHAAADNAPLFQIDGLSRLNFQGTDIVHFPALKEMIHLFGLRDTLCAQDEQRVFKSSSNSRVTFPGFFSWNRSSRPEIWA